jgi:cell division protein FtsW
VKHYQRRRVYSLFSNDPKVMERGGYQQLRALEAIGSGGPWGKGRGNVSAAQHVPEAHTDMILALIGEQYGFAGVATVLLTYCLLFTAGLAVAGAQQEPAGRLLAVGLVVLMAGQMMFNVGVVFRLLPVTGLTLPFISYGGSSLVANCAIVGLLINIARHQRRRIF